MKRVVFVLLMGWSVFLSSKEEVEEEKAQNENSLFTYMLKDRVQHIKKYFPLICQQLGTVYRKSIINDIKFLYVTNIDAVAQTVGLTILLNINKLKEHYNQINGILIHELVHIAQDLRIQKNSDRWLVESVAEFIRYKMLFYSKTNNPSINQSYTKGYGFGVALLIYLENTVNPYIVQKIHDLGYQVEKLESYLKEDLDSIWLKAKKFYQDIPNRLRYFITDKRIFSLFKDRLKKNFSLLLNPNPLRDKEEALFFDSKGNIVCVMPLLYTYPEKINYMASMIIKKLQKYYHLNHSSVIAEAIRKLALKKLKIKNINYNKNYDLLTNTCNIALFIEFLEKKLNKNLIVSLHRGMLNGKVQKVLATLQLITGNNYENLKLEFLNSVI